MLFATLSIRIEIKSQRNCKSEFCEANYKLTSIGDLSNIGVCRLSEARRDIMNFIERREAQTGRTHSE